MAYVEGSTSPARRQTVSLGHRFPLHANTADPCCRPPRQTLTSPAGLHHSVTSPNRLHQSLTDQPTASSHPRHQQPTKACAASSSWPSRHYCYTAATPPLIRSSPTSDQSQQATSRRLDQWEAGCRVAPRRKPSTSCPGGPCACAPCPGSRGGCGCWPGTTCPGT